MAPKKVQVEEVALLGRFKTQLKIGVVGLPNVGKSSFFNTITKSSVAAENYPFCTIDPHETVPDERFDFLVAQFQPKNNVPAFLHLMDIAGLVKGASDGEGLGNAFLSHISGCDAIFHMIRAFDNLEISHVEGDVDPIRDIKIIMDELRLKDIEYVNARLEQMEKTVIRAQDKARFYEVDTLKKCKEILESGKWVKTEKKWTAKEFADGLLGDDEKLLPSALPKIIKAGFTKLQLEYFFTAGKDEVKAWTIRKGSKAPQAAGKIHSDFEKGFIMAEVMKFEDFKEHGSEAAVKNCGKYRQEGKQYIVQDGDIIFFKFNAGAGLSKKK